MTFSVMSKILKLPRWTTFLFAVSITLVTLYARHLLLNIFETRPLHIMFMPTIILSAVVGGWWPGIISIGISAIGVYFHFLPRAEGIFNSKITEYDFLQWSFLFFSGILISFFDRKAAQCYNIS